MGPPDSVASRQVVCGEADGMMWSRIPIASPPVSCSLKPGVPVMLMNLTFVKVAQAELTLGQSTNLDPYVESP